ncbi:hypothetical protein PB2503_11899 [Parvularcula bermudensis HTCC2503]|uniref:Glycosyltransferase RgtA/B/C/D-like domain-containing protein n=1 Tax=Parvularcula bermudensis (strain ATCC BAA-594 / HTCC2503 / KCTC 12087) TaxID=314260 RepID=E0TDX5_PARBH|nr:hypothetical protein [Parvularcula bermudensis]ADM10424.1 hypothetical protein PB2503_11899 [Parvularcula bermudensis HTCC2503]
MILSPPALRLGDRAFPIFPAKGEGGMMMSLAILGLSGLLAALYLPAGTYIVDEGTYGYLARRVLEGGRLNLDIQDHHTGLITYANAGAMALFGDDLLSLRVPLAVMMVGQTGLAMILLARLPAPYPLLGGLVAMAFSYGVWINPNPSWYAVFLSFGLAALLTTEGRLGVLPLAFAAGVVVGVIFGFRQSTAVFLALAVSCLIFLVPARDAAAPRPLAATWPARGIFVLAAGLIVYYALANLQSAGAVFFALGPLAIVLACARRVTLGPVETACRLAALCLGGTVALLPLVAIHLGQGSLGPWLHDILIAPLTLIDLPFFDDASYWLLPLAGLASLAAGDPMGLVIFGFWTSLLLAPLLVSGLAAAAILRGQIDVKTLSLPIIAGFHGLVAAHYEIPVYLLLTPALSLTALIAIAPRRCRAAAAALASFCAGIALLFVAGQPQAASLADQARLRPTVAVPMALAGALGGEGIVLPAHLVSQEAQTVAMITACTDPGEAIFAAPMSGHLYYLADRPAPFRYWGTAFGLTDETAIKTAIAQLTGPKAPAMIVLDPQDKYRTAALDTVLAESLPFYTPLGAIGARRLYLHSRRAPRDGCRLMETP